MKKDQVQSRPNIPALEITETMSKVERFQNSVLRPIIKMKHELLIAHFKNYFASKKIRWTELPDARKIDFIERAFTRDLALRSETRGLVIGHFTLEEYHHYKKIVRDSNKRVNNMIKERIISHLDTLIP